MAMKAVLRAHEANIAMHRPVNPLTDEQVDRVLTAVAQRYSMTPAELTNGCRYDHAVKARRVAALILSQRGLSTVRIGKALGRDHSTIVNVLQKARVNPQDTQTAQELMTQLASGGG